MTLDEYQRRALATAIYPNKGNNIVYPTLKLNGEAGEVAELVGKMFRDDNGEMTVERASKIIGELGDVLWYIAAIASELGCALSTIGQINLEKLASRKERGALRGSGSDR